MAGYTKIGSTVKQLTNAYGKVTGDVKLLKAGWVKEGGIMRRIWGGTPVPSNMIILYSNTSEIPSDSSVASTFNNRFVAGANIGSYSLTGSNVHSGADHGNTNVTQSGAASHIKDLRSRAFGANGDAAQFGAHSHLIQHTHTTSNIYHIPPYFTGIPTTGAEYIAPNAFFPATADLTPSGWLALARAAAKYYLRLYISNATSGGAFTHQHASWSGYSDTTSLNVNSNSTYLRDRFWARTHRHKMNHQHPAENNDPYYYDVGFYYTNKYIWQLEDLPSGVVAIFTNSVIPAGWSRLNLADGRLLRSRDGAFGARAGRGTSTMPSVNAGLSYTLYSVTNYEGETGSDLYWFGNHSHSGVHTHPGAVDIRPARVNITLAVKN